MLYFNYDREKKQNTLTVHWLWFVFIFPRLILKECCQGIVISSYSQKKSCFIYQKWNWIQKFDYQRKSSTKKKQVSEYIVDETILKGGSEFIWLWIAIEPENRLILAHNITKE